MGFFPVVTPPAVLGPAALLAEPWFVPADGIYLAWTHDPALDTGTATVTAEAGIVQLTRINVRSPLTVTSIIVNVGVAGVSLTAAENFAGLINSAGTVIGVTADQSTNWASAGIVSAALTGGPYAIPAGFYWVGLLANSSGGTSQPGFGKLSATSSAAAMNPGLTVATARYGQSGSGLTAFPGSITPASNLFLNTPIWAALS